MKLHYLPGACPLATQIVLEWMGQPYELQLVERTKLKSPEYLALNPIGSVPTLEDGDLKLTQGIAILEYLSELHPESGLHGKTARERAEVRRWLCVCNVDIHRTFALIFGVQAYSDDAAIQELIIKKTIERLVFLFGVVNRQLENKKWLTGTRSIADPYLFLLLRWAKAKSIDLSALSNLQTFFTTMQADHGVQTALKKQGLD